MSKNYTTNILDLGGKVAGNVSGTFTMVITPKPGYVVRKGDFTAVEDPDVGTISIGTLTQTDDDYAVGNTVGIPITLTNFQMPAADTKIKIDITGNAKLASTIPQTSNISFTIINNLVTSAGQGVTITSATGSNGFTPSSGTPGTGNVSFNGNFSQGEGGTLIQNEEELLEIGQIIVSATATSVTISGIQTDGDEQSANVLSGAISGVSPGDIVTGQNVPSGTTVLEIEAIPGGTNSQIIFSNNMPSQTVDLTFTSDQELGDDPEIGDGPKPSGGDNRVAGDDNFVRFEEVGRTLSASGKAKTITYKLFVNTKSKSLPGDNRKITLAGKSKPATSSRKITSVDFGSTEIDKNGETRTLKVYGDVGAKVNITLVDSTGTPKNVFTAVTDGEIVSTNDFSRGVSFFSKQFTIPRLAGSTFTPPFKLNIDAGTGTVKSADIEDDSPDYTLNQREYPKLTFNIIPQGTGSQTTLTSQVVTAGQKDTTVATSNLGNISVGQPASGSQLPSGTTVTAVVDAGSGNHTVTFSQNSTSSSASNIVIGSGDAAQYSTPSATIITGRPNIEASKLNYLNNSGNVVNLDFVLKITGNHNFGNPLVSTISPINISNFDSSFTSIGFSSVTKISDKVARVKLGLILGTWGTADKTYNLQLTGLINHSSGA
jgi:hypothetical protein